MQKKAILVFITALFLIGGTAILLARFQSTQRLGNPGVKIAAKPIYDSDGKLLSTNAVDLPERVLDFDSTPVPVTQLEFNWLPKDTSYGRRLYTAVDGFHVAISVILMGADRTSIHQPQYCLPGQGWVIRNSEPMHVSMSQPRPYELPVTKLTLQREIKTADGKTTTLSGIFVYWFVAEDTLTGDHADRMWTMAKVLLKTGKLQRWAFVTFFSSCLPGQEGVTFERLKQTIRAATPQFQTTTGSLPAVRSHIDS